MRLATFNVENLFARAKAMDNAVRDVGQPALAAFETFHRIAAHDVGPRGIDVGYPELTSAGHAASDHAAVWVDLDF